MKNCKLILLTGVMIVLLSVTGAAQVSADSIGSLKQQKQSLELSTKINNQKMQLAKLENTLDKKTREMQQTAEVAQKAANENEQAATKLSSDPQDRQLAKKAESAGDNAKKSAKRARIAAENLADLNKDIESLKRKIAEEETTLSVNPVLIPVQQ